jgi:hypothetical protein
MDGWLVHIKVLSTKVDLDMWPCYSGPHDKVKMSGLQETLRS